jgi:hypothetical protein
MVLVARIRRRLEPLETMKDIADWPERVARARYRIGALAPTAGSVNASYGVSLKQSLANRRIYGLWGTACGKLPSC